MNQLYLYAYKLASLPEGYTGGRLRWNRWLGEYRAHPSDNDLEKLNGLSGEPYRDARDKVAGNDQWMREDAELNRRLGGKSIREHAAGYDEAREEMRRTARLDPARVAKYQQKIDMLVAALRERKARATGN